MLQTIIANNLTAQQILDTAKSSAELVKREELPFSRQSLHCITFTCDNIATYIKLKKELIELTFSHEDKEHADIAKFGFFISEKTAECSGFDFVLKHEIKDYEADYQG